MFILYVLFIGFLVGAVARLLSPDGARGGFLVTVCIGIGGAIVGTYGGRAVGLYSESQSAGFIAAVLGAILLLAATRMLRRA